MRYSLSQETWRLKGVMPHVPMQGTIMETGRPFRGLTPWIDCQVPGGVSLALYRAGWLEYPYYGMNSLKCEWVENRWWMYETTFRKPKLTGTKFKLLFHGVDYDALIYLNSRFLGEHVGMYDAFSYDITEEFLKSETLRLQVMIKHAPDEVAQVGRTSETTTQKARFNYKWDFGTRLVNLGIWEDVEIVAENDFVLTDLHIGSDLDDWGRGILRCFGGVEANVETEETLLVDVDIALNGETKCSATLDVIDLRFGEELLIPNPELWYPNGYGKQPLYRVTLTLRAGNMVMDTWSCNQGIRKLRLVENETAPEDALPYTYEINNEKMYIKGVNITPLDHIYGDIPVERYETTVRAIAAMNVNLIRVWGGGLIEKECFYDLCDRYGILVWQEFIQSSSGIDNEPSKKPEFLELLEKTSRYAVKVKRNHTCLAAWSGGNELQNPTGVPSGYDDSNIAMLKALCDELDPERLMYPTSASGPVERQSKIPNTSHDVHGDWEYGGNPQHYHDQATADHLLNSEFGCSGVSPTKSACRVLPKDQWKPADMTDNAVWRFRGDWWCTYQRDVEMFGQFRDLPEFTSASQWMQAEAVRYTVEANRRRAFRNSGCVIWQFNEPWPNIACTCLYTYYDDPKMAYFWAKQAYAPYHVSLDYRRLDHKPGSTFRADIWLSRDTRDVIAEAEITAEVLAVDGRCLYTEKRICALDDRHSSRCTELTFTVPKEEVFAVRITAESGAYRDTNSYFFSTLEEKIYEPYLRLPKPEVKARLICEEPDKLVYEIANIGSTVALHVHAMELTDHCIVLPEDDFLTLFPGESRTVTLAVYPRFNYGFDEYRNLPADCHPQIQFIPFPQEGMLFDGK